MCAHVCALVLHTRRVPFVWTLVRARAFMIHMYGLHIMGAWCVLLLLVFIVQYLPYVCGFRGLCVTRRTSMKIYDVVTHTYIISIGEQRPHHKNVGRLFARFESALCLCCARFPCTIALARGS